jgi:S-(hydroxymethyl)glutathione dehydrogenase/alcohol dehydrogenase
MRAAVVKELGRPFTVEDIDVLPPGPRDILVRAQAAAYCVTDTINRDGRLGKQGQTVLGHSACGVVEQVGADVTRVKVGDRVQCGGSPECGECYNCARGRPDQCARLFEFKLPLGVSQADGKDVFTCPVGGYAEVMRIPDIWAFPVQTSLPADVLCMLGCGVTSGLGAVFNIAGVDPGSSVAIVGAGQLGLWMTQGARVAGAAQIVVVEPIAERRALAAELGATDVVDPADGDPVEQVKELTAGRGADYSFEAAGTPEAMEQTLRMTLNTGVVVLTGVETLTSTITLSALEIAIRGRDIRNCQNGRCRFRRDLPRFIGLIEDGHVDPRPIISGHYGLDELNELADRAWARTELTGVVVPNGA